MKIRKGPYGHFACEELKNYQIIEHAIEMINTGILTNSLNIYINTSFNNSEICFDFSGLQSIVQLNNVDDDIKRNALGDLFLTFKSLLNSLIPLSTIVLDEKFIFTDREFKTLHICINPETESDSPDMSLSAINIENTEKLLRGTVFKYCVSEEEINEIIYSIRTNNEELFFSIAKHLNTSKAPQKINKANSTNILKRYLTIVLLFALSSLLMCMISNRLTSTILLIFAVVILTKTLLENKAKQTKISEELKQTLKDTRKNILFGEDTNTNNISSHQCMYLIPENQEYNEEESFGIYSSKVLIGSDYFLVDIFIDDNSISPIQAEIENIEGTFYIHQISDKSPTFLESHKLVRDRKYEIKNGQKLTVGNKKYIAKIGFNN